MSENKDLDTIIKQTQLSLGKYVKKPALTDKLLKKPPFRFLHDVINVIIRDTGHFKNVFSQEDLVSENVKDRESKINFLQKLIDYLKVNSKEPILAKPSKIVAGHEPEKTNQLLQQIAHILDNTSDSNTTKKNVSPKEKSSKKDDNSREKQTKLPNSKETPKPRLSKTSSLDKSREKYETGKKLKPKVASKETSPDKKQKPLEKKTKKAESEIQTRKEVPKDTSEDVETAPQIPKSRRNSENQRSSGSGSRKSSAEQKPERKSSGEQSSEKVNISETPKKRKNSSIEIQALNLILEDQKISLETEIQKPAEAPKEEPLKPIEISKPKSPEPAAVPKPEPVVAKPDSPKMIANIKSTSLQRQPSISNRPKTSLRPPSARPASARPGAPRRRDKNIDIVLQPNEQTEMAGINVRIESFNAELEDDGENLIVIENSNAETEIEGFKQPVDVMIVDDDHHQKGHLVQQILETQKNLIQADDERPTTQKHRQTSASQIDSLRTFIQSLTKAVNPLGKLMEFIPEDVDAMQLELTMWRDNYIQATSELKKEKGLIDSATEPLKNQLSVLEGNIKEFKNMIAITRAKILMNDNKIRNLFLE